MRGEYAQAGVDYTKIEPFKRIMIEAGQQTLAFPNSRHVFVDEDVVHAHGAVYGYLGPHPHLMCQTTEGLGNLNWIAEWMYQYSGTGRTYYEIIARAAALIIAIDTIAQGAMPVIWTDEVAAGDSEWFADELRAADYARGCVEVCREVGMALPAGESPALRYLVKAEPPVKSAPSLSGCINGIIAPSRRLVTGQGLRPGLSIVGVPSTGLGANGISLVIKRAMALKDQFCTKLPNGRMLGEECLIPVRSYVALVEALFENEIKIESILPATGDGVGKLAFDHRPMTYRVKNWVKEVPLLFQFMRELGVSIEDCLKTFNWGMGIYFFVAPDKVEGVIQIGQQAGYEPLLLGWTEEGPRQTIFEPEGITLPPPGQ